MVTQDRQGQNSGTEAGESEALDPKGGVRSADINESIRAKKRWDGKNSVRWEPAGVKTQIESGAVNMMTLDMNC